MGKRFRALILFVALVGVGVFGGSALSRWLELPGSAVAADAMGRVARPAGRVRVEVLNAGGRQGLARDATESLRTLGFDVVYFGNAGEAARAAVGEGGDGAVVLDRVGRVDLARGVADALGIRDVRSVPDSNLYLDVSVVVGSDWDLPVAARPAEVAAPSPWWDVRRFLPREREGFGEDGGEDGGEREERPAEPARGAREGTMADPGRQGDR